MSKPELHKNLFSLCGLSVDFESPDWADLSHPVIRHTHSPFPSSPPRGYQAGVGQSENDRSRGYCKDPHWRMVLVPPPPQQIWISRRRCWASAALAAQLVRSTSAHAHIRAHTSAHTGAKEAQI